MFRPITVLKAFAFFWVLFLASNFFISREKVNNSLTNLHTNLLATLIEKQIPAITIWKTEIDNNGNMGFHVCDRKGLEAASRNGTNVQSGTYKYHPFVNIFIPSLFLISLSLATPLSWSKRILLLFVNGILFYCFLAVRFSYGFKSYLATPGYNITPVYTAAQYNELRSTFQFLDRIGLILIVITFIWVFQLLLNYNRRELLNRLMDSK